MRKLILNREALIELSSNDLANVAGGAPGISILPCLSIEESCRACSLRCPFTAVNCEV